MLIIKKLYSQPEIFDPITFESGFNLILGETTEGNIKTNGVGKSMAVEFINYALLKRHGDSRVSLIPAESLSRDVVICLDFELNGYAITSKRTLNDHECPTLIINNKVNNYSRLTDATAHLNTLIGGFSESFEDIPSFRTMMGPLIRDEGSEFKSIINCFDTNKRIPPDYTPHLYFLQIDPHPYKKAKLLSTEMERISKSKSKMEENIAELTGKNISESRADLNELENQVSHIQRDIDKLENIQGFDIVKDEIIEIETKLEQSRSTQAVLKSELSRLKLFQGDNYINSQEVSDLYNQFKSGLGDLIKKELDEVISFKKKIDHFQRSIIDGRKSFLESEIKQIDDSITLLSNIYREKVSLLDQEGLLVSLKQTISIHEKKIEEHSALSSFIQKHTDYENEYKYKKREREDAIYLLESFIENAKEIIFSFERTILDMHNYIFGNRRCSFNIDVSKKKEILNFDLRIDSDGSHSINRGKVFLYDFSLLINQGTSKNHLNFLIHDNIFDVDQDTLIKSINFVGENIELIKEKQYILTINSDKFSDNDLKLLKIDLHEYTRASFTKNKRFLKMHYQELSK
ncbi:DUF2326 domain-containing protein [Aeromonas veronii]|nr:DUF2326 domain-containing protein [Aeromonas veronii]